MSCVVDVEDEVEDHNHRCSEYDKATEKSRETP